MQAKTGRENLNESVCGRATTESVIVLAKIRLFEKSPDSLWSQRLANALINPKFERRSMIKIVTETNVERPVLWCSVLTYLWDPNLSEVA